MAQQGELGQPREVLPPELESPVEGMSWPIIAPQLVEETQPEGGSALLAPLLPQVGGGRQPRPPSPPPVPRLTEWGDNGREERGEMEEEPQGCRHPWEENKEKMPPLPVTGR